MEPFTGLMGVCSPGSFDEEELSRSQELNNTEAAKTERILIGMAMGDLGKKGFKLF